MAAAAAVGAGEAASRVDGAGGSYSPTSPCSPGRNSRGRDDEEQVAAALKGDAVAAGGVVVDVSVAGGDDMGKGGTEGGGGVRAEALSGRGAGMEKASASACSCPWEDSASEQSEGENAERGSKACTGAGDYCDGGDSWFAVLMLLIFFFLFAVMWLESYAQFYPKTVLFVCMQLYFVVFPSPPQPFSTEEL